MSAPVHDFRQSLAKSEAYTDARWLEELYRNAFPNMIGMQVVPGNTLMQRLGVDRIVYLSSGAAVKVDEKIREREYTDVLLEVWSSVEQRRPGWIEQDSQTDYLFYIMRDPSPAKRHAYLWDMVHVRRVWRRFGPIWKAAADRHDPGFAWIDARNSGYTTRCLAVPIASFCKVMLLAQQVKWPLEVVE